MTEERDARQRKDKTPTLCPCGASPTVLHISWECDIYKDFRQPISLPICQNLPTCTKYSAIITDDTNLTNQQIIILQESLVNIWQNYIRDFKTGHRSEMTQSKNTDEEKSFDQNGHLLKPRPNGQPGVYCCKCGKFVARSKHIKLKITSHPCPQKDSTVILQEEGFNRSEARLDELFQKLQSDYNSTAKHSLEWNRKIGKIPNTPDEGLLSCTTCLRKWKWKDRANLKRSSCKPPTNPPAVIREPTTTPNPSVQVPHRSIRSKTSLNTTAQPSMSSNARTDASGHPVSDVFTTSRPGSSTDSASWRTGIG